MVEGLDRLVAGLDADAWSAAAEAIMTTDTFPKGASRSAEIGGTKVTLNGIAKGSGMIAPDMATMLAFVMTDAKLPAPLLQRSVAARQRAFLQRHYRGRRYLHQRFPGFGRDGACARHRSYAGGHLTWRIPPFGISAMPWTSS